METATISISARKKEIVNDYLAELDKHMIELKAGEVDRAKEIRDFAEALHIHPVHLSLTIKEVTGKSSCDHYEERLVALSKELLTTTNLPISQIAIQLTYDPSNFTKFLKHFTGNTPKKFRDQHSFQKS